MSVQSNTFPAYIREKHLQLVDVPVSSMAEMCSVKWDFHPWFISIEKCGIWGAYRNTVQNKEQALERAAIWRELKLSGSSRYSWKAHARCVLAAWGERKIQDIIWKLMQAELRMAEAA